MHLEIDEVLALASEAAGSQHWSRNTARPRYSLSARDVAERNFVHSFTCFDVAERVETEYDIVFAGRSNGTVVLWRMVTRNLFGGANKNDRVEETLVSASPHRGAVTCLTHTRPGTYGSLVGPLVFSGSNDQTVKMWNAWAGASFKEACLQTMAEHRGGVTALSFAGDTTLISAARDGSVRLWRPQRGRKLLKFPFFCCVKCLSMYPAVGGGRVPRPLDQPGSMARVWPTAMCVAGGETWTLYCGDSEGTVSVFQRSSISAAERLASAKKRLDNLTMEQLADNEVSLCRRWAHLHSLAITGLVLVPEHNFLLSMGNDGVCRVLDYLQGNTFMTIENNDRQLFTSVAWDLAHEQLVLADASGVVQIWNTYTESLLLKKKVAKAVASTRPRKGQTLKALLGFYSSKADGMLYGMSPAEGCFFRWKMVKAGGSTLIGRHDGSIIGLGFQHAASLAGRHKCGAGLAETTPDVTTAGFKLDNNAVVAAGVREGGGTPVTANLEEGANRLVVKSGHPRRGLRDAAGEARGRLDSELGAAKESGEGEARFESVVLSASMDGVIIAWEMLGKSEKYRMRHPAGVEVTSMVVLPGGSVLVTGTDDGSLRFWRLETGAGESFRAHENTVSALAACMDRQGSVVLASGSFEGTITIWRAHAKDGSNRHQVPTVDFSIGSAHGAADGSDPEVLCLAFVATDAPLLASAGNDRIVRCWGFREHACVLLAMLEGHKDSIEALVTDGLFVLSGSCDGVVRVWNVVSLEHKDQSSAEEDASASISCCRGGENGQADAAIMTVGHIQAHADRIAGLAIMATGSPRQRRRSSTVLAKGEEEALELEDVGGLLVTCGDAEGVVKIWDYTHVKDDGSCGRLVTEVRPHDESLFSCIACTQDARGGALLFAGTDQGNVLELDVDDIDYIGHIGAGDREQGGLGDSKLD